MEDEPIDWKLLGNFVKLTVQFTALGIVLGLLLFVLFVILWERLMVIVEEVFRIFPQLLDHIEYIPLISFLIVGLVFLIFLTAALLYYTKNFKFREY